ncbi:MAG TPA: tetratricopeptide repeat protein, partial [Acidobacteriota bacterium]|nr:tetratricopeptide repeat protein [Acidobacteriota bacterium]
SNRPEDFEAFLAEYPTGDRAKIARIMLSKLTPKKEPAPSTVPKTRPIHPEPDSVVAPPIPKAESRPVATSPPATVPVRKKGADASLKSLKTTRFILDRGLNKLTQGDYDGAIQDLYQARELDPAQTSEIGQSLARAYYLRGLTRKNQQNFSGAILDLKSSVELNPNLAEAQAALGRLYFREGNLEAAIPSSQRALDLDPQNTQYQNELLKQYLQLGERQYEKAQFEKAELAYFAALKLSPSDALIHIRLGECQAAQGKNLEAEANFREAVRLQPASSDYLRTLAIHLFQQNMFAEAIPQLKNYLQTEPNDGKMHFTLGLAYEQTLDFQNAEAALATALRLKNGEAEYHHVFGRVLEKQGRIQAAFASYQTAAGLDPRNAAVSTDLHRVSELLKPSSVATGGELQLQAITRDPHDPDTFLVMEFQVLHPADSRLEAHLYAVDRSLDQKIGSDEIKLTRASRQVSLKIRGQGPNLPILRH